MPKLRIRIKAPGGAWTETTLTPMTFAEEFPDAGPGLPLDWLATDFSCEWADDGALIVYENNFTLKELRGIDTGVAPDLVRMRDGDEKELRYPPEISPELYDEKTRRWVARPR